MSPVAPCNRTGSVSIDLLHICEELRKNIIRHRNAYNFAVCTVLTTVATVGCLHLCIHQYFDGHRCISQLQTMCVKLRREVGL